MDPALPSRSGRSGDIGGPDDVEDNGEVALFDDADVGRREEPDPVLFDRDLAVGAVKAPMGFSGVNVPKWQETHLLTAVRGRSGHPGVLGRLHCH